MDDRQTIMLGVLVAAILLFLIQWFRQVRHILRGGQRPLALTNVFVNWGLIILAVLAGVGLLNSGFQAEAKPAARSTVTSSSTAKRSSTRANSSSVKTQKGEQVAADQPAPTHKTVRLANGKALVNFNVPAQTQFQVVAADSGNVLRTFTPQQSSTTVSYTFTKAGNYYLIVTKGQQAKTVTVTINQ